MRDAHIRSTECYLNAYTQLILGSRVKLQIAGLVTDSAVGSARKVVTDRF